MGSDAGQGPASALSACPSLPLSLCWDTPPDPDPQPMSPKNRHAQGSEQAPECLLTVDRKSHWPSLPGRGAGGRRALFRC